MSNLALTADILNDLRRRRASGERVSDLARPLNVKWQLLDKALRHGKGINAGIPGPSPQPMQAFPPKCLHSEGCPTDVPAMTPAGRAGPLTERYRPRSLEAILGQTQARKILTRFAAAPHPTAFLFEGETGTGKTSACVALAAALGCDIAQEEFGGVWTIGSGDQTAETVRSTFDRLWMTPMCGSGWKVLIVNEADRIGKVAETLWLDRLEGIPPRSVIVFTTNFAGSLSPRLRDRFTRVEFVSDAAALELDARRLIAGIWRAERGEYPTGETVGQIVEKSTESGNLSFRRIVQAVESKLLSL